jgi:hypothetical protein
MTKYSKEQVIAWLELIRDGIVYEGDIDEEDFAEAAIEYLKASMPAIEGDDA